MGLVAIIVDGGYQVSVFAVIGYVILYSAKEFPDNEYS